jgi:hypothetical protein
VASSVPAAADVVASSPKLERLTGLVCIVSPVTPDCSGMMMAGFNIFWGWPFVGACPWPCDAFCGIAL